MRMRWAWGSFAALVLAGCARDGRDTQPPRDGEPTSTAPQHPTDAHTDREPAIAKPEPAPYAERTEPEPTVAEARAKAGFEPPTEAEFRAWDRKDPEAEAKIDAWDRKNLARMLRTYDELRCFHHAVLLAGERHVADPSTEPEWFAFKQASISALDTWQKRLFADNPRILEKSRFIGFLLEAHELVMFTYVKAYDERDRTDLDKCDAHWFLVESKIRKRAALLGGELAASPQRCDVSAAP